MKLKELGVVFKISIEEERRLILEEAKKREQEIIEEYSFANPKKTGMSKEEFIVAMQTAIDGGEDATGFITYVDTLAQLCRRKAFQRLLTRITGGKSQSAPAMLAATLGVQVRDIVGKFQVSGKWRVYPLPEGVTIEEETKEDGVNEKRSHLF